MLAKAALPRIGAEGRRRRFGVRYDRDAPRPKSNKQRLPVVSEPCRRAVALATGVDVSFLVELLNARMQLLLDQEAGVRRGETVFVARSLLIPEIDAFGQVLRG